MGWGIDLKGIVSPFTALKYLGKHPHTVRYPYEKKETAKRYRGFHINDLEKCVGCGNCAKICMNETIDMVKVEGIEPKTGDSGLRPKVDYGRCCWCALCVDVCPTGSLKLSTDYVYVDEDPNSFIYIPGLERKEYEENVGWTCETELDSLLDLERVPMKIMPPEERVKTFAEAVYGYTVEEAKREAERCTGCGVCISACPDRMHIPDYIKAIRDGQFDESVRIIYENNPLPEMCGKVCTRRCEFNCIMSHRAGQDNAIAIRWLKRFACEQFESYEEVLNLEPQPLNGKKVAIVGGGPSGLTVAYYLRLKGYETVIFEEMPKAGGMTMIGIPKYRFPIPSLDKQLNHIKSVGVEIRENTKVVKGEPKSPNEVSFEKLKEEFDAVYLGIGLTQPMKLGVEGEDLEGSIQALPLLRAVNFGEKINVGQKAVVIGGGNVAMDCVRVLRRFGVDVTLSYRRREVDMPADHEEIHEAKEEGVVFRTQTIHVEIIGDENGKVKAIKIQRAEMKPDPKGGRPRPVPIEGAYEVWECDNVIAAIGQKADYSFLPEEVVEKLDLQWGKIPVNERGMTKIEGIFAGGDAVNWTADAISAIADGLKAVRGIDEYLSKK